MLHAPGAAIHASQRRAGDFESNESGSHHAEVSAQQIPPVLGQRPKVFPTQVEHSCSAAAAAAVARILLLFLCGNSKVNRDPRIHLAWQPPKSSVLLYYP